MMRQSLRYASGLPRDKKNWQMKKYAAIKIKNMVAFSENVSPTTITTRKEITPRRKATLTLDIFICRLI